jgi:hypothetical protein
LPIQLPINDTEDLSWVIKRTQRLTRNPTNASALCGEGVLTSDTSNAHPVPRVAAASHINICAWAKIRGKRLKAAKHIAAIVGFDSLSWLTSKAAVKLVLTTTISTCYKRLHVNRKECTLQISRNGFTTFLKNFGNAKMVNTNRTPATSSQKRAQINFSALVLG